MARLIEIFGLKSGVGAQSASDAQIAFLKAEVERLQAIEAELHQARAEQVRLADALRAATARIEFLEGQAGRRRAFDDELNATLAEGMRHVEALRAAGNFSSPENDEVAQ